MDTASYIGPDDAPDRYRLRRSIGRGGEAVLYLAELELGGATEPVVVKMLDDRQALAPELFARVSAKWREQAELLRFVHRPGVVGIREHFEGPSAHPAGVLPEGGGRALYLVMNHVQGLDLRDWRAERTLKSAEERRAAVRCLEQLAEVLDWLHSGAATPSGRRVVHGDLSPGNVMIDAHGQATLVDFGLSKLAAEHRTAEVWFTPGFAAPEVFEGIRSPATDRYAFGAIAYFLLSGESPAPVPETLRAALLALPELAALAPEKAARVAAIFAAAPESRPDSLTGWVRELRSPVVSATRPEPPPRPPAGTRTPAGAARTARAARRAGARTAAARARAAAGLPLARARLAGAGGRADLRRRRPGGGACGSRSRRSSRRRSSGAVRCWASCWRAGRRTTTPASTRRPRPPRPPRSSRRPGTARAARRPAAPPRAPRPTATAATPPTRPCWPTSRPPTSPPSRWSATPPPSTASSTRTRSRRRTATATAPPAWTATPSTTSARSTRSWTSSSAWTTTARTSARPSRCSRTASGSSATGPRSESRFTRSSTSPGCCGCGWSGPRTTRGTAGSPCWATRR